MSHNPRTRLHSQARTELGIPAWGFLFSLPFLAAGVGIIGLGLEIIPHKAESIHVPRWVLTQLGLCFFMAGLWMAILAVQGSLRRRRAQGMRGAPWRFDYPWSRQTMDDDSKRKLRQGLISLLFIGLFLLAMHGAFLFARGARSGDVWVAYLVFGLFDLLFVGYVIYFGYLLMRRLRFGNTRLHFHQFPFYTGSRLQLRFEGGPALARINTLHASLRCVQEVMETHQRGNRRETRQVCYQIYQDALALQTDARGSAEIDFPLPADVPGTQLLQQPPTYWELSMQAALPGVDYAAVFLLPVYTNES